MIATSITKQSAFPAREEADFHLPQRIIPKNTRDVYTYACSCDDLKDTLVNQSPTFISNIRFVLFTLRGTPRLAKALLACIKLFPTEGNSDRLQGFIRQTLINPIIDHISARTRDQKKILVYVIILPTEIFGNFRSHAMSRYNSWNNFIQRARYYTSSSIPRSSSCEGDLPRISNIKYASEQISRRVVHFCTPVYRTLRRYVSWPATNCNVTSRRIRELHSGRIASSGTSFCDDKARENFVTCSCLKNIGRHKVRFASLLVSQLRQQTESLIIMAAVIKDYLTTHFHMFIYYSRFNDNSI